LGFFKKLFIADALSIYVDFIYSHLHASGTPLVVGLYLYPLQIYADFSGLSDIAIGTAWMFGIQTPENFNAPFWAPSPSEFWRRWHITLTSLLTDYVFTPLRMALRKLENVGLVFSLFVTMVLIGLWHGARWTYVFFGAIHATYLAIDALTLRARKRFYKTHPATGRLMGWFGPLVTFHLVAAAFVFFRAETLSDGLFVIRAIGSSFGMLSQEFAKLMADSGRTLVIGLSAFAAVELADYLRRNSHDGELVRSMPPLTRCLVYSCTTVAAVLMILCLLGTQVQPSTFVYAMF
jgi:D-alanyl-lipoteichoic acid acyltransferase DltB (MBOAT superfamily)